MMKKIQMRWIVLMCLWLLPVLFPAAVYAYSPTAGSGVEKKTIQNNQFQVTLECGWKGISGRSSGVPARITVVNNGPEFEGTLKVMISTESDNGSDIVTKFFDQLFLRVRSVGSGRNQTFIYEVPMEIEQKGTVTKEFSMSLTEYNETDVTITLENSRQETVCSDSKRISALDLSNSRIAVGILEGDSECASRIDGMEIGDMGYRLHAVSIAPEDLTKEMAQSGEPDVLIFAEQSRESLDEKQKENVSRWENSGGLVIDFWDSSCDPELLRKLFSIDPENMIRILLSQEVLARIPALSGNYYNVDYENSWLLEGKAIRRQPNSILFLGLLFTYAALAGPVLYLILKKREKRRYLWPCICALSLGFVILIAVLGNRTVMKAPVIVYKDSLFQNGNLLDENLDFEIQVPYNSGCKVYLDPSYRMSPGNLINAFTTELDGTAQEGFEQIRMRYGESKNELVLSNQPAFTLNAFRLSKSVTLDNGGVSADLTWMDGQLTGTVKNESGYELEDCVVMLPGYMAYVGKIKNGETLSVDHLETDSVRDSSEWLRQKLGSGDRTKAFCAQAGSWSLNRMEDSLIIGVVQGREETFQLYSGYETLGDTFYTARIEVSRTQENGTVYCPYAQEYYMTDQQSFAYGRYPGSLIMDGQQMEVTYLLNAAFEDGIMGEKGISSLISEIFGSSDAVDEMEKENVSSSLGYIRTLTENPEEMLSVREGNVEYLEFRKPDVLSDSWQAFEGKIEVYNYSTGIYETLEDWKLQEASGKYRIPSPYFSNGNQIKIRYTLTDEEVSSDYYKKMGAYQLPDLIVKISDDRKETYDLQETMEADAVGSEF